MYHNFARRLIADLMDPDPWALYCKPGPVYYDFNDFSEATKIQIQNIVAHFSEVVGLTFIYEPDLKTLRDIHGKILHIYQQPGLLASTEHIAEVRWDSDPDTCSLSKTLCIDISAVTNVQSKLDELQKTLFHELFHAAGLRHPNETIFAPIHQYSSMDPTLENIMQRRHLYAALDVTAAEEQIKRMNDSTYCSPYFQNCFFMLDWVLPAITSGAAGCSGTILAIIVDNYLKKFDISQPNRKRILMGLQLLLCGLIALEVDATQIFPYMISMLAFLTIQYLNKNSKAQALIFGTATASAYLATERFAHSNMLINSGTGMLGASIGVAASYRIENYFAPSILPM